MVQAAERQRDMTRGHGPTQQQESMENAPAAAESVAPKASTHVPRTTGELAEMWRQEDLAASGETTVLSILSTVSVSGTMYRQMESMLSPHSFAQAALSSVPVASAGNARGLNVDAVVAYLTRTVVSPAADMLLDDLLVVKEPARKAASQRGSSRAAYGPHRLSAQRWARHDGYATPEDAQQRIKYL